MLMRSHIGQFFVDACHISFTWAGVAVQTECVPQIKLRRANSVNLTDKQVMVDKQGNDFHPADVVEEMPGHKFFFFSFFFSKQIH